MIDVNTLRTMDQYKLKCVMFALITIFLLALAVVVDMSEAPLFYGLIALNALFALYSGVRWVAYP